MRNKRIKHQKNIFERGFTIIEFLLYMGILALLLTVMVDVFVSVLNVQTESESTSGVVQDGRYILARLSHDIHNATAITLPATYGTSSAILQLDFSGNRYNYQINNGNLQVFRDGSWNSLNSYNTTVSNLSFTKLGNAAIKSNILIRFTLTSNTKRINILESETFQTTVGLR